MRRLFAPLFLVIIAHPARAEEPKLTAKPDAFPTLVNPNLFALPR